MNRRPRPRGEPILARGVMVTCGLVGLFVAIANVALIVVGENHYGAVKIGQSMSRVAFSLMVVVASFEARSETATAFDTEVFNSSRMNLIAAPKVAGAFLITQADSMRRLLGTARLTAAQWGFALLAACCPSAGRRQVDGAPKSPSHNRDQDPRCHRAVTALSPIVLEWRGGMVGECQPRSSRGRTSLVTDRAGVCF